MGPIASVRGAVHAAMFRHRGLQVQIEISPLGDRLVRITLTGRLDTQGVDQVETRFISAAVPAGKHAVVDLSGVEFVASMGIRMFVSTARSLKVRQAVMALFGASPQVTQVFETVMLQKIIPVCATEADALAAVGAPSV